MRRMLGTLALTLGLMLAIAAPSQATVSLDPDQVPFAATAGGDSVTSPVVLSVSADEASRNLTNIHITQGLSAYSFTEDCPTTFPAGAQACTIQVTLNPKTAGLPAGLFPAELSAIVEGGGGPKTAVALLAGIVSPAQPNLPNLPGLPGATKPGKTPLPTGKGAVKGKGKGCKKAKGKGKGKKNSAYVSKQGKKKCGGRKKGKGKVKGK